MRPLSKLSDDWYMDDDDVALRGAIVEPHAFYDRGPERGKLSAARGHAAIVGVRRSGKSALLQKELVRCRDDEDLCVGHVRFVTEFEEGWTWHSFAEELLKCARRAVGVEGPLAKRPLSVDALFSDLYAVLARAPSRVVLGLDEIDSVLYSARLIDQRNHTSHEASIRTTLERLARDPSLPVRLIVTATARVDLTLADSLALIGLGVSDDPSVVAVGPFDKEPVQDMVREQCWHPERVLPYLRELSTACGNRPYFLKAILAHAEERPDWLSAAVASAASFLSQGGPPTGRWYARPVFRFLVEPEASPSGGYFDADEQAVVVHLAEAGGRLTADELAFQSEACGAATQRLLEAGWLLLDAQGALCWQADILQPILEPYVRRLSDYRRQAALSRWR